MKTKLLKLLLPAFIFVGIKSFGAFDKPKTLFEQNKGQVVNAGGVILNDVLFRASLPGASIWITENGLVYNFYKENKKESTEPGTKPITESVDWYRSVMNLKGAHITAKNLSTFKQASFNYTYQKNNKAPIETNLFEELVFADVYEGIDWRLYIYKTSGGLDVNDTRISFSNPVGIFTEGDLYCYQDAKNNAVKAKYTSNKQITVIDGINIYTHYVKIKTENFEPNKTLVTDPTLY